MAKLRMPTTALQRKLPSLFLGTCITLVVIFVLNQLDGLYERHSGEVSDEGKLERFGVLDHVDSHSSRKLHRRRKLKTISHDYPDDYVVCRTPKLSLKTDSNRHAFYAMAPLECNGDSLMYVDKISEKLVINETVLKKQERKLVKCLYYNIEWMFGDNYAYSTIPIKKEEAPFVVDEFQGDFTKMECYLEEDKNRYNMNYNNEEEQVHDRNNNEEQHDNTKRRLLGVDEVKQNNIESVQLPRHIGSIGMPDPVYMNGLPNQANDEQNVKPSQKHSVNKEHNTITKDSENKKLNNENQERVNVKRLRENDLGKVVSDKEESDTSAENGAGEGENGAGEGENGAGEGENDFHDDTANDERIEAMNELGTPSELYDAQDEYYNGNVYNGGMMADFEQYFVEVKVKADVIKRMKETPAFKHSLQMNVLIVGLDSMSHLSYQRKLPKTYKYLKETLGSAILNGYNIVGDATTAAILPMMTGKNETELPEVRKGQEGSTYVDSMPLVWNKYEQSGYVTMFAEDQPGFGVFNLRFNGFEEPPVDHYMRPFWIAAMGSYLHDQHSNQFCLGNRPEHQYQLDYTLDFFKKYKDYPKFGFMFYGELSHADNNPVEHMDNDLMQMFKSMKDGGYLDNTLLIVMADHGARYSKVRHTVQGKLEERLPLMSLAFPESFKQNHRNYYNNVRTNVDRLTTPFDIYETLRDLIDTTRADTPVKYNSRGMSLLHEIPANRTCKSAHIDVHWCTCMKYEEVDKSHEYVVHSAKLLVNHINSIIAAHQNQCMPLSLSQIVDAKMIIPNEKLLKFLQNIDPDQRIANFSKQIDFDIVSYQIIIVTSPNLGQYEGTVQYTIATDEWQVTPEVSRINAYGSHPSCILKDYPHLRKYCYCRNQIQSSAIKKKT